MTTADVAGVPLESAIICLCDVASFGGMAAVGGHAAEWKSRIGRVMAYDYYDVIRCRPPFAFPRDKSAPLRGYGCDDDIDPRAAPWAVIARPFGALTRPQHLHFGSANTLHYLLNYG